MPRAREDVGEWEPSRQGRPESSWLSHSQEQPGSMQWLWVTVSPEIRGKRSPPGLPAEQGE